MTTACCGFDFDWVSLRGAKWAGLGQTWPPANSGQPDLALARARSQIPGGPGSVSP